MKCDICGWREAKVVVYLIGGGELKNKLFFALLVLRRSLFLG